MNKDAMINELLQMDGHCTKSSLMPGDVIETWSGNIGVISSARTVINGCSIEWNMDLPDVIEHGHCPTYAVKFLKRVSEKEAWWEASEFGRIVDLCPARFYS